MAEGSRLSSEERTARGKGARRAAPRASHGRWQPAAGRPDPVALLEEQASSRVPELVPVRYGRMIESPFAFYRGAALVMAADLAATPTSGLTVQACGDAHLSNFGLFASPERRMMFDINDFDETLPGPWEWDVKRLAASFEVGGRERGFSGPDRRMIVTAAVREYRLQMRRSARMGTLDVWYDHTDSQAITATIERERARGRIGAREAREFMADIAKARRRDSARAFSKRATDIEGEVQFIANPPLVVPVEDLLPAGRSRDDLEREMELLVERYRETLPTAYHPVEAFRYLHLARSVVGVGSVGTRCWLILMLGRDEADPLILQAKEAGPSVLERFVGTSSFANGASGNAVSGNGASANAAPANRGFANQGQRVVEGQRLMQAVSDIFLGWKRIEGFDGQSRDYYIRQFHDWKGSLDLEKVGVPGAMLYAELCGETLARAHARSGDRVAIAGYLGGGDAFDRAVADFAVAYAEQNERDYERFTAAVASGRLVAERGL